jgi:hypothetical protein
LLGFGILLAVMPFVVGMAGCGMMPTEIRDWHDLSDVRDDLRGSYVLMNDLDSTTAGYEELAGRTANEGKGWQPIGSTDVNNAFAGILDGQGHEIHDLFIDRPDESDVALFGAVESAAVVENVCLVNGSVTGYEAAGSVAGYNRGTVRYSSASGNVTGGLGVGGLVGINGGTVSSSYAGGIVTGRDGVGGLVGSNEGTVSSSYSTGTVNGSDIVGSLIGLNDGTASNSYARGTVNGSDFVGGLAGRNEGTVSRCYSTGGVIGHEYVGGLVGQNLYGVVSNSFWDTQTSGQSNSDGGTGKTTVELKATATFSGVGWQIIAVISSATRNGDYVWNIVDDETYPFLSWQST